MTVLIPSNMLQPQTFQDVMMKRSAMTDRRKRRQMEEELLPYKEALLQAQTQKALTPATPNVWQQQFNEFERLARGKGMTQDQIDNAKGLFMLQKLAGGGQTTSVQMPGGGGVTIGKPAIGGLGDLYQAFGGQAPEPVGIGATKPEQTALEAQMRGAEQASKILPNVLENIKYKHPVHAAIADAVGFMETFAPQLTESLGLQGSKGLAKYKSSLGEVKEKLTKAYGLRSTDKTNADVQNIIEGARFEKPEDAKQRIHKMMLDLRGTYEKNAQHLVKGYPAKMEVDAKKQVQEVSHQDKDVRDYVQRQVERARKAGYKLTEDEVLAHLEKHGVKVKHGA